MLYIIIQYFLNSFPLRQLCPINSQSIEIFFVPPQRNWKTLRSLQDEKYSSTKLQIQMDLGLYHSRDYISFWYRTQATFGIFQILLAFSSEGFDLLIYHVSFLFQIIRKSMSVYTFLHEYDISRGKITKSTNCPFEICVTT